MPRKGALKMKDKQSKIESIIAKTGLSEEEKKVARVYYDSKSAGKKTKFWVSHLSAERHVQLLASAQQKVEPFLNKGASR